jgi:luciferase family oxidoreductase group 1
MVPFSILDLSPIVEGGSAAESLQHSLDLAQQAERWGYRRFWVAEHHNMDGVASSATAVLIGHVAAGTRTIHVGSGGVMLPHHAPLVIAEQFGTLATLYPGRIDLGLGRAPGADQITLRALRRRANAADEDSFLLDVQELQSYLADPRPGQHVRAIPGAGTHVPIWLLGSSLFSAQAAALLGLPFAFASHFAPAMLMPALREYRLAFRPSAVLARPHAMIGVNVICADTDAEAEFHATALYLRFLAMQRGRSIPVPRPVRSMEGMWSPVERERVMQMLEVTAIGGLQTVRTALERLVALTEADELIVATVTHDHSARLRSYELLAGMSDFFGEEQVSPGR